MVMMVMLIGLALLLAPGCINYGLMTGYRGWVRWISLLVFVGLPAMILTYLCFRQQAFTEMAAREPGNYDYHEDAQGAVLVLLTTPVMVSGVISSLIAGLVLLLRKRKLGTR